MWSAAAVARSAAAAFHCGSVELPRAGDAAVFDRSTAVPFDRPPCTDRGRAAAGTVTRADAILVRSFEDLPQKPNARFRAP